MKRLDVIIIFFSCYLWFGGFKRGIYFLLLSDCMGVIMNLGRVEILVISSQADSLIKISRIWADFFPQTHRISLFRLFFHHFWRYFRFYWDLSHWRIIWSTRNRLAGWITSPVGYRFQQPLYLAFTKPNCRLMMQKQVLHLGTDAGFHVFDVDGRFVLARMLLQGFTLPGRSAISQSTSTSVSSSRCGAPW